MEFLIRTLSEAITVATVEKAKDAFSIEECLSFSFRPMLPSKNFHYQSSDVPTLDQEDLEEPRPPVEQRVEMANRQDSYLTECTESLKE